MNNHAFKENDLHTPAAEQDADWTMWFFHAGLYLMLAVFPLTLAIVVLASTQAGMLTMPTVLGQSPAAARPLMLVFGIHSLLAYVLVSKLRKISQETAESSRKLGRILGAWTVLGILAGLFYFAFLLLVGTPDFHHIPWWLSKVFYVSLLLPVAALYAGAICLLNLVVHAFRNRTA